MARPLHIACLQTRPMESMAAALGEAMPLAEAAAKAGAQMIFLPEYCGGLRSDGARLTPPSASEDSHSVLRALRDFAARAKVWINIGSLAIDEPEGRILNRAYMIDDSGGIVGRYDKIHLFDVTLSETRQYRESETVAPGNRAILLDTPHGLVGQTICYDIRFPHLYRRLAQAGAEILCCPAAFTKETGRAHWHVLNRARAIENLAFMVSACAVGPVPGGGESYGHSLIVAPWGGVLADAGTQPGLVQARIDLDEVTAARKRIPSLGHDRDFSVIQSEGAVA